MTTDENAPFDLAAAAREAAQSLATAEGSQRADQAVALASTFCRELKSAEMVDPDALHNRITL